MSDLSAFARRPDRLGRVAACLLGVAPICLATAASADDMSMKGMPMANMPMGTASANKAPSASMATKAPVAPPVYNWTGCYVGVNAGGGAGSSDFNTSVGPGTYLGAADAATVSQDASGSHNNSSVLGGGQAGCNWQAGTVVIGLEGDYDYFRSTSAFYNNTDPPLSNTNTFSAGESLTSNYLATLRPRIGIAADRNFAYVTGGAAFSDARYTASYTDTNPSSGSAAASKSLTGWVAGAGWEYAWTDRWIIRFEYLYAAFPNTTVNGVITTVGGSNPFHGSADLTLQVARAGLNFKF